jgi:predicted TIM-barrel fold metal-dependent hydrolase
MRQLLMAGASLLVVPLLASGQQPPPILDMHLHAYMAAEFGPPPRPLCIPVSLYARGADPCPDPILSPMTDEAMIAQTVEILRRRNIIGVLSGYTLENVRRFQNSGPDRFIPAYQLRLDREKTLSPDELRRHFEAGALKVLGEILNQYAGIAPNDERMEAYWALAEELDIPAGIHLGEGYPGAPYLDDPHYRARLGSPLLLEDVLVRHPKLRIYVMHYGSPLVEEMVALLYTHPQVYVDIGGIQWTYPREYFYRQLKQFMEAGFGKRVMFGSDQMVWPGLIEPALAVIEEAPFLSEEQKRDILYNNAARFLRLSHEEIARHHGR